MDIEWSRSKLSHCLSHYNPYNDNGVTRQKENDEGGENLVSGGWERGG